MQGSLLYYEKRDESKKGKRKADLKSGERLWRGTTFFNYPLKQI